MAKPRTLNGRTGRVLDAEVDGKAAKIVEHEQIVLVDASLEELVHTAALKQRQIIEQGKVYSAAGSALNALKKDREKIWAEIIKRDPVGAQLAFEQEQGDVTDDEPVDEGGASVSVPPHPAGKK